MRTDETKPSTGKKMARKKKKKENGKTAGTTVWLFLKRLHLESLWPRIPLLGVHIPKKTESKCSSKTLDVNVHSRTSHNCQKVGTTPVSISRWMENLVHAFNETAFSD